LLVESTMRRLLQRAGLDEGEIAILRGQLRKIRWKLANPGDLRGKG
jgi:tRNA C32,U32 (ribose-2'-O)-methylase TrmJ